MNRHRRFQSEFGGILCSIYVITLFVYILTLMLEYSSGETIAVNVDESFVDLDTNYTFTPNTETGFNMAFGFYEKSVGLEFGRWRVRLVNRHYN